MTELNKNLEQPKGAKLRTNGNTKPRAAASKPTKKPQLIRMLQRKGGADVAAISKKMGWQSHTTRAALTGLRKAGYQISAEKPGNGKPSVYRISAEPAAVSN